MYFMAEISNSLPQGTILRGAKNTYTIQQALGQGIFGITYLATTTMKVNGQNGSFMAKIQVAVKEFFMRDLNAREGLEVTGGSQGSYFSDYKRKYLQEPLPIPNKLVGHASQRDNVVGHASQRDSSR